jgi:hypothetical protein
LPSSDQLGNNGGVNTRVAFAAAANALVAIATFLYLGLNVVGGAAAARNTARFSSIVFAIALAARFHRRFACYYVSLLYAFVAAHVVHFGTVIAFHALLGKLLNPMFLGVATGGSLLIAATALTVARAPKSHLVLTYVIWLSFVVALSSRLSKHLLPEAPLIALLAVAMIAHLRNLVTKREPSATSASA